MMASSRDWPGVSWAESSPSPSNFMEGSKSGELRAMMEKTWSCWALSNSTALCRRFTSQAIDVAVPVGRLSDVPDEVPRRLPPTSRICRLRLLQLLELKRFSPMATGYVRRWLERTPHGERATLSGWMSERWPEVRLLGLLSMADADCRCFDPGPGAAVVTHETALVQLGSTPFVILDAPRLIPRPLVLEGRRLRELRALYALAEVPFDDENPPSAEAVLDVTGPPSLERLVTEGLARALRSFAGQPTRVEPVDVTSLLRSANALLLTNRSSSGPPSHQPG